MNTKNDTRPRRSLILIAAFAVVGGAIVTSLGWWHDRPEVPLTTPSLRGVVSALDDTQATGIQASLLRTFTAAMFSMTIARTRS
jgi:hypothetical protein